MAFFLRAPAACENPPSLPINKLLWFIIDIAFLKLHSTCITFESFLTSPLKGCINVISSFRELITCCHFSKPQSLFILPDTLVPTSLA